ncbi:MAG: hypothetical protein H6811_05495 [Phycisphaeraceae bacterium]|nr:hypothetical protein [Phycisphaeraceae bacterium]
MTSRNLRSSIILTLAGGALLLSPVCGCSKKKKPEPPPPPPPRPVEAPPPEPVNMTQIRASMRGLDARVQFEQDYAPTDRELAKQVLTFCSALAKKDADTLRPMMDADARQILNQVEQGWDQNEIQAVRVVSLSQGGGGRIKGRGGSGSAIDLGPILEDAFAQADMSQVPESQRAMSRAMVQQMIQQFRALPPDQVRAMMQQALDSARNMSPEQRIALEANAPQGADVDALVNSQIEQTQAMLDRIDAAMADSAGGDAPDAETSTLSAVFITAVQDQDDAFVLMWEANQYADGWVFSSMPATDHTRRSVRDWDGLTITDYQAEALALDVGPDEDENDLPTRPTPPPAQGGGGARPGSTTSGG